MATLSRPPAILGAPARLAALRLLDAVLRRGEPLESALTAATRHIHGPDRGLAHAIAAEVLRRLPDLDALIDSVTERALPDDAKARMALRIALVQVLVLGTPQHAAISTALPLVEGGPRKLVHGVFSAIMKSGVLLPEVPALPAPVEYRWDAAWGGEVADAAARAIAAPPPLDVTLADWSSTAQWAERLGGISLAPGHVRIADHASVVDMPGYKDGAWWVQDLAATIPARIIGTGPEGGEGTAIDLCAAPGGKTLQLVAQGWHVAAVDSSQARIKRLRENLYRTHSKAEVVHGDALLWSPAAPVDALLIDAPCSATGIFRRHPDVLHRVRPSVIAEMAAVQARILARAADWVKPGGTLVYATCSLEPAEGEVQLDAFLSARSDYAIDAPDAAMLPPGIPVSDRGYVRTLPGMLEAEGGCDGFFVARLRRAA
ncbi:RsmB/NOP family class I SAM-dependent RNA methyltransferase [Sphingomonas oligophenolica]|uniref:SAM-dependent methyltransferase n=1 Tax=Sphingomonas oligophenolica TaxID=301154 RepID=A0A502CFA1_9SPHN|nr:transcription antitermination factor NusB [Sphingomonas oligophenolica]TPG10436.1 SAM-dependent methyltransferase [Sphingomonas oligophenolica]